MDTPRKVGYGRGAGRLDTGAPVSSPVGRRPQLSADPVYDVPPVLAPGPLAAGPPVSAALYEDAGQVNAVAIKLPELWQSHVQSWFAQAEAQFATSGVSASLTKYYHVIKSLPENVIVRIPDLLTPPTDDPYSKLKARLLELYDMSDYEKAELLNALPPVDGDMRPSMLLDRMRALTPTNELDNPNSLFCYAFLSRLPPDIRVSCVPFVGVETLADVARRADAQFRARPKYVMPLQVSSVPRDDDERVEDELHAVKPRAGGSPQSSPLCFYHEKYGRRALKCRRPCRWSAAQGNFRGRN